MQKFMKFLVSIVAALLVFATPTALHAEDDLVTVHVKPVELKESYGYMTLFDINGERVRFSYDDDYGNTATQCKVGDTVRITAPSFDKHPIDEIEINGKKMAPKYYDESNFAVFEFKADKPGDYFARYYNKKRDAKGDVNFTADLTYKVGDKTYYPTMEFDVEGYYKPTPEYEETYRTMTAKDGDHITIRVYRSLAFGSKDLCPYVNYLSINGTILEPVSYNDEYDIESFEFIAPAGNYDIKLLNKAPAKSETKQEVKKEETKKPANNKKVPEAGDPTNIAQLVALLSVSAAGIYTSKKSIKK